MYANPLRWLLWGLFFLLASGCLWRGREKAFEVTDKWVYGEEKGDRTLAFLEFENLGGEEAKSFDSFKKTIPLSIAQKLRYKDSINVPIDDYIPVIRNLSVYKVDNFSSKEIGSSNYQYVFTNGKLAYYFRGADDSVLAYSYKTKASDYIDANLLELHTKVDLSIGTNLQDFRYFYTKPSGGRHGVKLKINPTIYGLIGGAPLWKVFSKIDFNYLVYGAFKVDGVFITLHLFVINKVQRSITHIYSKRFKSIYINRELKDLYVPLLAFLERKSMVGDIIFTSSTTNGLLYLDGKLVGRLPKKVNSLVAGDYKYRVWSPGKKLVRIYSDSSILKGGAVSLRRSNINIDFELSKERRRGNLNVKIRNGVGALLYLNNNLVAFNETYYREKLLPGQYFFQAQQSNYEPRRFEVSIQSDETTELSFMMKERKPKTIWEEIFLDHALNVKVFATLGFIFGSGTIINHIQSLDYEDKKNEAKRRLEDLKKAKKDFKSMDLQHEEMRRKYNDSVRISLGLFSGSLISFIFMTVSHFYDVWEDRAEIDTEVSSAGDVEVRYKKMLDF